MPSVSKYSTFIKRRINRTWILIFVLSLIIFRAWVWRGNVDIVSTESIVNGYKPILYSKREDNRSSHKLRVQSDSLHVYSGSVSFENGAFSVKDRVVKFYSGAFHYFRSFPENWKERLLKLRACGLNTVETYVPWNLHEEYPGEFNFQGILDVRKFLQTAHEVGLYVLFRPGPYICSEWDFGGLPAWLLSDPNMKVRTNYPGYQDAVRRYFAKLIPLVADLQYMYGGPIIAFQVENEYGSYSDDSGHLMFLRNLYIEHGVKELLITSDNDAGITRDLFYEYALPTANFNDIKKGKQMFETIKSWSPHFPLMVTEYWTGWFDHWGKMHNGMSVKAFEEALGHILDVNASVNLYMFHGGTNFGFMSGANHFRGGQYNPDVTSYDYDALLTEAGDVTPKYRKAREMFLKHVLKDQGISKLPDIPPDSPKAAYGKIPVERMMEFEDILGLVQNSVHLKNPVPMEMLKIRGEYGQNFGYTLYRIKTSRRGSVLKFTSAPADRIQVFVNGYPEGILNWKSRTWEVSINSGHLSTEGNQVDILVENHGRVNYGLIDDGIFNQQRKGLNGDVLLDGDVLENWTIYPLEFKQDFIERAQVSVKWKSSTSSGHALRTPTLYSTKLNIRSSDAPKDTFLYMEEWRKGIVLINGFNLGRYWEIGPQQTLYVPGPLLKQGENQIIVFEQERQGSHLVFQDNPVLNQLKIIV